MVMTIVPIRLPDGLIKQVDSLVGKGQYSNRSDVLRTALRKLFWEEKIGKFVGIMPDTGDSVKEIREIRRKLSKEPFDIKKVKS